MGSLFSSSKNNKLQTKSSKINPKKSRKSVMKQSFDYDPNFFIFTNRLKNFETRKNFKLSKQVLKNFEFVIMKTSKIHKRTNLQNL